MLLIQKTEKKETETAGILAPSQMESTTPRQALKQLMLLEFIRRPNDILLTEFGLGCHFVRVKCSIDYYKCNLIARLCCAAFNSKSNMVPLISVADCSLRLN